jgi:hypothetical protein
MYMCTCSFACRQAACKCMHGMCSVAARIRRRRQVQNSTEDSVARHPGMMISSMLCPTLCPRCPCCNTLPPPPLPPFPSHGPCCNTKCPLAATLSAPLLQHSVPAALGVTPPPPAPAAGSWTRWACLLRGCWPAASTQTSSSRRSLRASRRLAQAATAAARAAAPPRGSPGPGRAATSF